MRPLSVTHPLWIISITLSVGVHTIFCSLYGKVYPLYLCLTMTFFPNRSMLPFMAAPGQFGAEVREEGLKVWRVEKMKAVLLDPSEVGAFYNGDSYLVLENRGQLGADLHMWIGERQTSGYTLSVRSRVIEHASMQSDLSSMYY